MIFPKSMGKSTVGVRCSLRGYIIIYNELPHLNAQIVIPSSQPPWRAKDRTIAQKWGQPRQRGLTTIIRLSLESLAQYIPRLLFFRTAKACVVSVADRQRFYWGENGSENWLLTSLTQLLPRTTTKISEELNVQAWVLHQNMSGILNLTAQGMHFTRQAKRLEV